MSKRKYREVIGTDGKLRRVRDMLPPKGWRLQGSGIARHGRRMRTYVVLVRRVEGTGDTWEEAYGKAIIKALKMDTQRP